MASGRFVIGGRAALAALFARLRRRPAPGDVAAPPGDAAAPAPEAVTEPQAVTKPQPIAVLEPEFDEPPDVLADEEVLELREELRSELRRLAEADIKASRTRRESTSPPG
jgi:hypothetical protein